VAIDPGSPVPIIGASGAIAGVMGAYLVLFPNVPIKSLVFIFITDVPAKFLLGFWFVLQFFTSSDSGVAWVAHVGGFVFGALVAFAFRDRLRAPPAGRAAY
jgi:membrane associated rhomboid family serine protease